MLRCVSKRTLSRVCPTCANTPLRLDLLAYQNRHRKHASSATSPRWLKKYDAAVDRYGILERLDVPADARLKSETWIALLETALPPHLRDSSFQDSKTPPELNVVETAEVLLGAQMITGFDYLHYLGAKQGRWRAFVWLSKHLIEAFASSRQPEDRLLQTVWPWDDSRSLADLTADPDGVVLAELQAQQAPRGSGTKPPSLEELTDDTKPHRLTRKERLSHSALGFIWRSLGKTTLSCADATDVDHSTMRPEILEVIAMMHHHELMPSTIYNFTPNPDPSALQQPPTLNIFSSRILTSLSDAAWRAHERAVLEEAQAKGGQYAAMRPEIPGSAYRVNVGGLTPEIWLELILWSCLHGGWIEDGAALLAFIEPQRPEWTPLSWRDRLNTLDPHAHRRSEDWNRLSALLQKGRSALSEESASELTTRRTISSDIVNCFIDALTLTIHVGVGDRGLSVPRSIGFIQALRAFLQRSELGLGTSTWDATLLKIMESGGVTIEKEPHLIGFLAPLTPPMRGEIDAPNAEHMPAYMFDGSAIAVGLHHQALRAQVKAGNLLAALKQFRKMQEWTDTNKMKSLEDFFANKQLPPTVPPKSKGLFDSHFSGIDFPSFNMQVPSSILAPLLDLAMDGGASKFADWLVYSEDIDGPVIHDGMYHDPQLKPVLLRFAIQKKDKTLLGKIVGPSITNNPSDNKPLRKRILRSFLNTQVRLKRWQTVQHTLDILAGTPGSTWNPNNLAELLRTMVKALPSAERGDEDSKRHFGAAGRIVRDMVHSRFGEDFNALKTEDEEERVNAMKTKCLLLTVSALGEQWSRWTMKLSGGAIEGFCIFHLPIETFNIVLEGILQSHGSVAARRILGIFWPHSVRTDEFPDKDPGGIGKLRRPRRNKGSLQRSVFHFPGTRNVEAAFHGGLEPNIATLRLVLARCVQEVREQANAAKPPSSPAPAASAVPAEKGDPDLSPTGMLTWALHCLHRLRMSDDDVRAEVRELMAGAELQRFRAEIPELERMFKKQTAEGSEVDGGRWYGH